MLSREEFLEKHRHELGGMILEAAAKYEGASLALFLRTAMRKIDQRLGQMYADLTPEPKPQTPTKPR